MTVIFSNNFLFNFTVQKSNGLSADELLQELDQCDLSNSHSTTPSSMSPCISNLQNAHHTRLKSSNVNFLNQNVSHSCSDL